MRYILRSKTWILHCAYTLTLILFWANGTSIWLSEAPSCFEQAHREDDALVQGANVLQKINDENNDCVPIDFRQDRVDALRPAVRLITISVILINAAFSIACFRWRWLADYMIFINITLFFITSIIPSKDTNMSEMYIGMIHAIMFVILTTDRPSQLVYHAFSHLMFRFVLMPVIYKQEVTVTSIGMGLFSVTAIFIVNSMLSLAMLYISQMHSRMKSTNIENAKLLDGMHEGLLIVSQSSNKPMFCNNPAYKLLKAAIEKLEVDGQVASSASHYESLVKSKILEVTQIAVKGHKNKLQSPLAQLNQALSLEQVILAQKDEPNQKVCIYKIVLEQ